MPAHRAPILPSRIEPLLRPIAAFLSAESAGGIVLIAFTVAALIWRNSPGGDTYDHFWEFRFSLTFGSCALSMSLEQWVNDCLMVLFFLLVGLEIKRELLDGSGEDAWLRESEERLDNALSDLAVVRDRFRKAQT